MSEAAPNTTPPPAPPAGSPDQGGPWSDSSPGASPKPREGVITDAAYDALSVADRDRYALIRKGPQGGQEWVARDKLSAAPADGKTGATTDGAIDPAQMAAADRVKLRGADGLEFELSPADVQRLMQAHSAETLRKTQVPADASLYEPKIPQTVKLPEGVEFKIDNADPALGDFRAWAHHRGLTQDDFSDALGIFAAREARQAAQFQAAAKAEAAKLGVNGTQRVDAVEMGLRGLVGDSMAGKMRPMIVSAAIVEGFEKILTKFASQGAAGFRQDGRVPHEGGGRVDEATYAAMTPAQKWDYARSHNQQQFK